MLSVIFFVDQNMLVQEGVYYMKYSRKKHKEMPIVASITFGVLSALLLQLIGAIVLAALVGEGTIGESSLNMLAHCIRAAGMIAGIIATWFLSGENKLINAGVCVLICYLIQVVSGLLLWQIDIASFWVGLAVAVVSFCVCAYILHAVTGKGKTVKFKKRYC